jgi:ribosomal protein S18 acetylase RimI-like enzyme
MTAPSFAIGPARTTGDLDAIRTLFRAYAASLDIDLCFQGFEDELAGLPGKYASPSGALLLARDHEGKALGCIAFRPLPTPGLCEMKRLYVTEDGRGMGLGSALVDAAIGHARQGGYGGMVLDTLPSMKAAIGLYHSRGFVPIDAYYETPIDGTIFLQKILA